MRQIYRRGLGAEMAANGQNKYIEPLLYSLSQLPAYDSLLRDFPLAIQAVKEKDVEKEEKEKEEEEG